jgi:AraC family transcriptional regulator
LAKIAAQRLASGDGWTVEDVICNAGPSDRPFEEQHNAVRIAIVLSGTFQYRSGNSRDLLTPGSLLLGNCGQSFECSHEHATGDRSLSFGYSRERFEELTQRSSIEFRRHRLPVLRELAPSVARAFAGACSWEEMSVTLAPQVFALASTEERPVREAPRNAEAAVTRLVRAIDRNPMAPFRLQSLARAARLSPFHFLRTFQRITGVTPHQYLLRSRLRAAAVRLHGNAAKVIDVALDAGFGDVSNFNRAFRAEFGVSPRAYRERAGILEAVSV